MGFAVSKEGLVASYVLQAAVLCVIMTNLTQYFYAHSVNKTPAWLMLFATLLVILAPIRNLGFNLCMQSFQQHGYDGTIEVVLNWSFNPLLSTHLLQWYTIAGYLLMFVATVQQTEVVPKFLRFWDSKKAVRKVYKQPDTRSDSSAMGKACDVPGSASDVEEFVNERRNAAGRDCRGGV